jgi:TPR repeat protein
MIRCFRMFGALATLLLLFAGSAPAQDPSLEEYLFEGMLKLATQGDHEAEYHVGMFFNNGIGVEADPKQAFGWFEKSAAGDHPLGAYKLGCYYHGQFAGVVPPDEALGMKYKLVAAEQGYDLAQSDVAKRYYVAKDFAQAVRWWTQAARQGDPESMYHLSNAYAQGQGAAVDLELSYRYLDAIRRMPQYGSDQFIIDALGALESKLTPAQLAAPALVAEPSALTLKARQGLSGAKFYLADRL